MGVPCKSMTTPRETTTLVPVSSEETLPTLVAQEGEAARFAYEELFHARLHNPHTRKAYRHAVQRFLQWCEEHSLTLTRITPAHVGHYVDQLTLTPATIKLHLAGLRHFFDVLVLRHVLILNPAASVRGPRYQVVEGKTPEITVLQARALLRTLDTSNVVGLRDQALLGILIYTAARVGAVSRLRCQDFQDLGDQHALRFLEKNGKSRSIPVRHDLRQFLRDYLQARFGDVRPDRTAPLFVSALGKTKKLSNNPLRPDDVTRMVKRRLRSAGLPDHLCSHSFRVATITDLLSQGVSLTEVKNLAGHVDPRTTQLYDRRHQNVSRNIVERISI